MRHEITDFGISPNERSTYNISEHSIALETSISIFIRTYLSIILSPPRRLPEGRLIRFTQTKSKVV